MTTNKKSRVIVGVDESLAGLRALRCAVIEARRRQATLFAVRIWSVPAAWPPSPMEVVSQEEMAQDAEAAVHRAFVAAMLEPPPGIDIRMAAVQGAPGPELVRLADRDDDLLVVGSSQRSLFGRLWHGSTARYCVGHASCPVLVVPPHALAKPGSVRAMSRQLHREVRRHVDAAQTAVRTPTRGRTASFFEAAMRPNRLGPVRSRPRPSVS